MSEQDRFEGETPEDEVEAHVKQGRGASDDDSDDVEAHVKQGRA